VIFNMGDRVWWYPPVGVGPVPYAERYAAIFGGYLKPGPDGFAAAVVFNEGVRCAFVANEIELQVRT
jgi:hypothetical protein